MINPPEALNSGDEYDQSTTDRLLAQHSSSNSMDYEE